MRKLAFTALSVFLRVQPWNGLLEIEADRSMWLQGEGCPRNLLFTELQNEVRSVLREADQASQEQRADAM